MLLLLICWELFAVTDPLSSAADYYYSKHDYRQALDLSNQVLQKFPDDLPTVMRVAELKLLLEGRTESRDVIQVYLKEFGDGVSSTTRTKVKEHLATLQSRFISDKGQSHYLQALPKFRRKDYAGALALLELAAVEDRGNLEVLRLKSQCEMELGQRDRQYQTLKAAFGLDPYASDIAEGLAEAHVQNRSYDRVVEMFASDPELLDSMKKRVAYSLSLWETNDLDSSYRLLHGLVLSDDATAYAPILYFAMGKMLARSKNNRLVAIHLLQKFTDLARRVDPIVWNPFHLPEKLEEAKALVVTLSQPT